VFSGKGGGEGGAHIVWVAEEDDPGDPRVQSGRELCRGLVRDLCALAVAAPDDPRAGTLHRRPVRQCDHAVRALVRAAGEKAELLRVSRDATHGRGGTHHTGAVRKHSLDDHTARLRVGQSVHKSGADSVADVSASCRGGRGLSVRMDAGRGRAERTIGAAGKYDNDAAALPLDEVVARVSGSASR